MSVFLLISKAWGIILSKNSVLFSVLGSLTVGACWPASSHRRRGMLGQNLGFCPLSFLLLQWRWGPGVRCCWGHCSRDGEGHKAGGRFTIRWALTKGQGSGICGLSCFIFHKYLKWTLNCETRPLSNNSYPLLVCYQQTKLPSLSSLSECVFG